MSFQDIKGHTKPIGILKSYLKDFLLDGSYLFIGPEGIGKKLVAKTLSKALNCEVHTLDSCDNCPACLKIDKNQHPDVYMIDSSTPIVKTFEQASSYSDRADSDAIRINHIRQLQKNIVLKPYEGKKKVFIIDNAHNLTPDASNAFLKILEEPPQNSLIILISAKPQLLFKTIISRCKTVRFWSLARTELKEILKKDYGLDDSMTHFLAYFCEGKMGHALRLKDTDILRDKNRVIDEFTIFKNHSSKSLAMQNRDDVRSYLNILATWFRDICLIKTGMPYSELINLDRRDELLMMMNRYTWLDLEELMNSISDSLLSLEQNINIKLLLSNLREDISYRARRVI
jgi:DNA polymerase-3 subunit delta'